MEPGNTKSARQDEAHRLRALIDETGRVRPGIICDECGYDLRGQPSQERCPECGDAIGPMLRSMVLADIRRPWYVFGTITALGLAIICLCASYVFNMLTSNYDPPRIDGYEVMQSTMACCGLLAMVAGVLAGLCECLGKPMLVIMSGVTSLGLFLAMVVCFVFVFLIAIP